MIIGIMIEKNIKENFDYECIYEFFQNAVILQKNQALYISINAENAGIGKLIFFVQFEISEKF